MSRELLASKVVVIEEEPRVRGIPSVPTSVTGAIGVTERGPIGTPVLCASLEDYRRRFGGFTPDSDLALAVAGFFENGGSQMWVVRTAHYADISDPASHAAARAVGHLLAPGAPTPAIVSGAASGPFALQSGDRLVFAVDGGPPQEVGFVGTAARVVAAGPGPFALADGETITARVDGGAEQALTLAADAFADIGAAAASELAAAINGQIVGGRAVLDGGVLVLESDTVGSASRVEVTGGTAAGALGFPAGPALGTGNVARIAAVTVAEVVAALEAATDDVLAVAGPGGELVLRTREVGPGASLQVQPATATAFGLDADLHEGSASGAAEALRVEGKDPGAYGNRLEIQLRPATSGDAGELDLAVIDDGVFREGFPNLSMDPEAPRYVERVVNDPRTGSVLVRVHDQHLPGRPVPPPQVVGLSGGDDGLALLDDADFIGSEPGKTGLHALDAVQDLSVLIVPGRATPAVQQAMLRYCEHDRDGGVFTILDPPAGASAAEIIQYVEQTAGLANLSEHAAIYWPRVTILNPARRVFGPEAQVVVAPSGIVAGVCARVDGARPGGVYDPPAGTEKAQLYGVLGFETPEVLEERRRDLVYPKRINPLTAGAGLGRYIDGSRTLKATGNFPFIAERRGVIFIATSLKRGLQFARHRNNTESLRAEVRRTITSFLVTQMRQGAFRSTEASKAFFVDVGDELNPPSEIFAGRLNVAVGLATNKPAEYVVIRLSQDTRALEAELAGA